MNSWPLVALGELCTGTHRWRRSSDAETISYIDISSVSQVTKRIESPKSLLAQDAPSRAQQIVQVGDVLISNVRPNLNAVARVTEQHHGNIASTGFTVLRTSSNLDSDYLFHFTQSSHFIEAVLKTATGASYPATSSHKIQSVLIPLPPLAEQRRTANLLDGADRLRKRYLEMRELSNAAIYEAVFSHFVSAKHYRPFRDVATLTGGSTPSKGNPDYWDGGTIPWFSTKDLKKAVLSDSIDHLTESAISSTSLRRNDRATVALSIRGMSLAHRLPMSVIPAGSTVNQDIKIVHSELPYSPLLWYAIFKHRESNLLSKVATSAHGTKRLETSHILDLDIPIWERRSLSTIEGLLSQQASLMESFDHLLQSANELYTSLATRGFSGEL